MNTLHRIFVTLVLAICALTAVLAEQVNVTVTPKRSVLPPHVMLYIANPGQYFNISVNNPESESQAIFFGAEIHQLSPTSGIDIIVPAKTMPKQGIVISAGQSRVLDAVEMRNMFNHVRQTDIDIPQDLFDNVLSNSFGYLEEGTYEIVINAYKWDPTLSSPVLLSNPTLSRCTFTVCYSASAPKWVSPVSLNDYEDRSIATLSLQTPMLQWTKPVVNCNPTPIQYTYDLKIVQAMPLQNPDDAIDRNPVVYQRTALTAEQVLIPTNIISKFSPTETYVAQITTRSNNTQEGALDFVSLQNDGKSDLLMFRVKDYTQKPDSGQSGKEEEEKDEEPGDSVDIFGLGGKGDKDSLYVFKNPEITTPKFSIADGARKLFVGNDIAVDWRKAWYQDGRGTRPDTIRFAYAVQLFAADGYLERTEMLEREPVYTSTSLTNLTDTIPWEKISGKVKTGDYLLIKVTPAALNENSVRFTEDSVSMIDFALTDRFAPKYFLCSNQKEITNTTPTNLAASALKGKTVKVGEYDLVFDGAAFEAVKDKPGHFKGTGHVIWQPMKFTWKLAVKFDDIAVNTDNEVFEGLVETFEGDTKEKIRGSEVVDKLFSDWGIDNLIADTGLPYADQLQQKVDGKVASLADELGNEISGYYQDIKAGKAKIAGLLKGDLENVTFPLSIPDDINPTPVNLEISKMKFAPDYASMDLIGTFVVPETEATKNQILIFGAPRICLSPTSLIPDGATIALLKDFTVNDPSTSYDCTFKAPKNVIEPEDGCFVSWSGGQFEMLRLDMDMTLPDLKKVVNDKVTDQHPQLHITADVKAPINKNGQKLAGWDWTATADLDPFEHEDLPGYTFHAADKVIIDHSSRENVKGMPAFPKDYDLKLADLQDKDDAEWMGVYIGELSMEFPEDIKVGDGEERMKVGLYNMLFDRSGMTVEAGIVNAINYKAGDEGSIGGFAISIDTISVNFIQNQHKDSRFTGKLNIPLFKGTVNYACNIYNQKFTKKGTKEGYAYVFKTWQMEGLNFDFMLGDLKLDKNLTYFLVEALPDENGDLQTNCELLLGGEVTIAGTETANEFIKSKLSMLPMDLTLPEIKFCKLRLANNKNFESTYEREMQTKAADATAKMQEEVGDKGKWWTEAEDIELCDGKFFLNFGQWGYASPQKKIGPFTFALTKYGFDLSDEQLTVTLGGGITFCDELNISADAAINIKAKVKNLSLKKIADVEFEYQEVELSEVSLGVEVTGLSLNGTLRTSDKETDKGYVGDLTLNVGGGLFELEAHGGYYDHKETVGEKEERFAWGYFIAKAGGRFGVPMTPIQLQSLTGGFYINCGFSGTKSDGKPDYTNVKANKGAIGLAFGVGLATADGATMKGDFEMAVCVLKNQKTGSHYLSTFNMTGDVTCLEGVINSKMTIVYENNDMNRYFQLNITADASADAMAKKIAGNITEVTSKLKEESDALQGKIEALTGKAQEIVSGATGGLSETLADKNENKATKSADEGKKTDEDESVRAKAGASVSLDLRIQTKKDGKQLDHVLWHVYLGQPDIDKRCNFTLIDFKSKIVTVSIGANAYLCLGSELPNNGQLPDLPAKVKAFLDGGSHGAAQSDNMSDATKARQRTVDAVKAALNSSTGGGVMLGAQVWGYIDLDLGLFFGNMGATAGFDVSITKLNATATCVNLGPGTPGYHHWYGQGQLYAYLYAAFGFKIDLGFFKKKLTLADAGLGGVLQAAMPNPNYFHGKARCKIKLLNGLVKIDKTFKFTAGQECDQFLGNALDDYQLFEGCNVGSDNIEEAAKNKISWQLDAKPRVTTQCVIDRQTRVLDPTEEARIKNSSAGDGIDDFSAWASRTFRFTLPDDNKGALKPHIIEYDTQDECKDNRNGRKSYVDYTINDEKVILSLTELNPNKWYRLVMNGRSQEFRAGKWKHPETWDSIKAKYVETPWLQEKVYYFATDNSIKRLTDIKDFDNFVSVAFPMGKESIDEGRPVLKTADYVDAPLCDIKRPMISMKQRTKGDFQANNTGTLYWAVYPSGYESYQTDENGVGAYPFSEKDYFYMQPNTWVENDSVSILMPQADLPVTANFTRGVVKLLYRWQEQVTSLGEWSVLRTYTTYSAGSRDEVYAKAVEDMRKQYGTVATLNRRGVTSTRKVSTDQYRVTVEQDEMANISDDSSQKKYVVTILKFGKSAKQVWFTKELLSVPVNWANRMKGVSDEDFVNIDAGANKYYASNYWASYCGTRINSITLDDGTNSSMMSMPYTPDKTLVGGSDKTETFNLVKGKNIVTVAKDPIAWMSYLSNIFFVSGYHIKSTSSHLNFEMTTSDGLWLGTPYVSMKSVGELKNDNYQYQVYNGYGTLLQDALMGPWTGRKAQTPYPMPYTDDERIPYDSKVEGVQRRLSDYLTQIKNLYTACGKLSWEIAYNLQGTDSWNEKSWRSWVSTHKSPAYTQVSYGNADDGMEYTMKYNNMQLAVVSGDMLWGNKGINNIVHTVSNDKLKNWRISSGSTNESIHNKMLYAAYSSPTTKLAQKGYKKTIAGAVIFRSDEALKLVKSISYTRYRVNAFNYKAKRLTVYTGNGLATPNAFFFKTSTLYNPFK